LKNYISKNIETIQRVGDVVIKLDHAGKMKLNTGEYIDRWLFSSADFEPLIVDLIKKFLSTNENFLDLGANIGYFSLIASRRIGVNGTVYAFEPTPSTLEQLTENIRLNNLNNIKIFKKAVSNTNGFSTFKTPAGTVRNSGRSSLRLIEEASTEIKVETVTIDSMLDQLEKIKVIKMDIEGAEGLALDGMVGLIRRDRPIIIMELTDHFLRQLGYSSELILLFFRNQDYKIFSLKDAVEEIFPESNFRDQQLDILCIPNEKSHLLH